MGAIESFGARLAHSGRYQLVIDPAGKTTYAKPASAAHAAIASATIKIAARA